MLRAIIIDDEIIAVNGLETMLQKYCPTVKVIGTATDAVKGIEIIEDYKPDLVFLDVSMPKMDGFELLSKLNYHEFKLVFTTAHQQYAIQAIKNRATDYLLKPVDAEELKRCIEVITEQRHSKDPKREQNRRLIELFVKDGIIFIRPEDIIRLEASGSYTTFYLENHVRHVASKNLKECEALLDSDIFFRCHPSHLVNLNKVEKLISVNGLFIKMSDGSMPEVTKKNKEILLERLKAI